MNSKKFKKFTALLLTVMLVLGTCATGISVSAEEIEESYQISTTQAYTTQPETATTVETTVATEITIQTEPSEEAEVSEVPQLIGSTDIVSEPAEVLTVSDDITVYFDNEFVETFEDDDGYVYENTYQWEQVYVYYWSDDNDSMVQWPGVEMDYFYYDDTDYYVSYSSERVAQIPSDAQYVIFNDNASNQTEQLKVPADGSVYRDGEWTDMTKEIFFSDRATLWGDWESENTGVYAYYWSDDNTSMVQWPGVELKSYDYGDYVDYTLMAEVDLDATYIMFHNNNGAKTVELTIPADFYRSLFSTTLNQWTNVDNAYGDTGEYNLAVVVGDEELCGSDWEYNLYDSYENVMNGYEDNYYYDDYTFTKTYKNVQPANNIQFKIVDISIGHGHYYGGKADNKVDWYGDVNGNDITFNVTEACDVTITYDYAYSWSDGADVTITVEGDGVVMSTDTTDDVFKYRVLDDGTASLVAYTETEFSDSEKTLVTIPTEIDGYKVTALDGTFAYNKNVEISEIPDSITSIGDCTFMTCYDEYGYDDVFHLEIGENVKSVGDFAYYVFNCERGYYTYRYSFAIPETVEELGKYSIIWYSTIYGYSNTEAERYANESECTFISMSDGKLIGDIELELKNNSNGMLTGELELEAGTYDFKINVGGKEYGGAYTINDKINNIPYSTEWKKSSTLNATGGKYIFEFDTANEALNVYYETEVSEVKVIGDIEYTLEKSSQDPRIFSGIVALNRYSNNSFKMSVDGVEYGFGAHFSDTMYNIPYSKDWSGSTTLYANYYNYSFSFDTCTNKLTVLPIMDVSSVSITGDIELALTQSETDTNVYSGTVDLEAGQYAFKVYTGSYTYCFGYTFTDYIWNIQYNSNWNSSTNFIATGGTYSFTYDTSTNRLTVMPVK